MEKNHVFVTTTIGQWFAISLKVREHLDWIAGRIRDVFKPLFLVEPNCSRVSCLHKQTDAYFGRFLMLRATDKVIHDLIRELRRIVDWLALKPVINSEMRNEQNFFSIPPNSPGRWA